MKKNKKLLIGIGIVVLLGIIAVGFYKLQQVSDDNVTRIGVLMPMTGENSTFAIPIRRGMELAISKCDPQKYKFYFADSKNDPRIALTCVQNFISVKHIKYIVGDFSSGTTLAIEPFTTQNNVFLLSPGAQSPKLSNISPLFARNYPSTLEESLSVANLVSGLSNKDRIAVLYANDEYGSALSKLFCDYLTKKNREINYVESFANDQVDFRAILAKLVSNNITLVYLAGNPKAMGLFMRQYGEYGISLKIVSNIAFLEKACLDVAKEAAYGVVVPVTYYNPDAPEYQSVREFATLYKETFGEMPTIAEAVGFDAINILLYGLECAKEKTPYGVGDVIRNLKGYQGATGVLNFTNGDVSFPIEFKRVEKSGIVNIDINELQEFLK